MGWHLDFKGKQKQHYVIEGREIWPSGGFWRRLSVSRVDCWIRETQRQGFQWKGKIQSDELFIFDVCIIIPTFITSGMKKLSKTLILLWEGILGVHRRMTQFCSILALSTTSNRVWERQNRRMARGGRTVNIKVVILAKAFSIYFMPAQWTYFKYIIALFLYPPISTFLRH